MSTLIRDISHRSQRSVYRSPRHRLPLCLLTLLHSHEIITALQHAVHGHVATMPVAQVQVYYLLERVL